MISECPFKLGNNEFQVNCFKGNDRNQIKYSLWPVSDPKEILVYLNGLESHSGWFSECAKELQEQRISSYGLDRRGSGVNAKINGDYNDGINDVNQLILKVSKEHPNSDINLTSLCFGARVATGEAIMNPENIDSLIYISPGLKTNVDLNSFEKILVGFSSFGLNIPVSSPIQDEKMFTQNPKKLEYIKNDVMRVVAPNASDFYQGFLLGKFDKAHLNEISVPSIVFLAKNDEISDVKSNIHNFLNMKCEAEVMVYPSSCHIIYFGKDKDNFISDLIKFMKESGKN